MRSKIAKELNEYLINDPTYGKSKETQEMTCVPYTGSLLILSDLGLNLKNATSISLEKSLAQVSNGSYVDNEYSDHYVFLERRLFIEANESIVNSIPMFKERAIPEDPAKTLFYERSIPQHILAKIKRSSENLNQDSDKDESASWVKVLEGIWAYVNCIFVSKDKIDDTIKNGDISADKRYVIKTSFSRGVNSGGNVKPNTGYIVSGVKDMTPSKTEPSGVSATIRKAQNDPFLTGSYRKKMRALIQELNK